MEKQEREDGWIAFIHSSGLQLICALTRSAESKKKKKQALSLSLNNKRLKNMMTHHFCLDFHPPHPQFVFKPCQHTGGKTIAAVVI